VGLIVLGLCLAAVGFAIVSISVGTGTSGQFDVTGASEVQSLLGGIRQDGPRLGSSSAPVTVQVFNDLQCDPCSDWNREVIVPLVRGPIRSGDVQLVFHHFPMSESGFGLGSYGAVTAAKQDDEWQFIELFYANQEEAKRRGVTDEFMDNVARAILNFNVEQWQDDRKDEDVQTTLEEDDRLSAERGLPAEPAVVVGGPNGSEQLASSPSLAEISAAVAKVR
jgi:protein-disulfide isomerase